MTGRLISMRSAGVGVILHAPEDSVPEVLHWGPDHGETTADELTTLVDVTRLARANNAIDASPRIGILPEARFGWAGEPGLVGARGDGSGWSPAWRRTRLLVDGQPVDEDRACGAGLVAVELRADDAGLTLTVEVELLASGLVRARAHVVNDADDAYRLDAMTLLFPVPQRADELLDFAGRWAVERHPQRRAFALGEHRRENRRGRTGHDSAYILHAGEPGFGYRSGDAWAAHVAWSGNHVHVAQHEGGGTKAIGGGELLLPGEIRLARGEGYRSPWVVFNFATGLDAQAARFHEHLRSLPVHPSTPRPVTLNTWEAVYFDHDLDRLRALADRAAELGVERFVLDDGWFGGRRHDRAGLGDWVVSPDVWPDGLHPLVDHVHELGMEFGLWIEPEMVNMDSDLARAHPEWVMQVAGRLPLESRHQQVLNLGIPEARDHVLGQLTAIFEEYRVDYVKWDHNRDLVDAGTAPEGRAGVAAQTRATYALLDQLRRRFPHMEIESCASGGGRIDLEVLERTERVWVSDNSDPEDRQRMLWWTGQLLPLELMGSHVASSPSHVTGRVHDVEFRAATAVFGHFGIEWDIAAATDDELDRLRWWIDWYKAHRDVLHTGRVVRLDLLEPGVYAKGVLTDEQAILSLAVLEGTPTVSIGRIRVPGLDPEARYRVHVIDRQGLPMPEMQVPWFAHDAVQLTGRQLATVGLQAPTMRPGTAVLFVLDRV